MVIVSQTADKRITAGESQIFSSFVLYARKFRENCEKNAKNCNFFLIQFKSSAKNKTNKSELQAKEVYEKRENARFENWNNKIFRIFFILIELININLTD